MRLRPFRRLGWPFLEAVDLQRKVGNQLFQVVVLPLEVLDLLTGGISDRIPGETLFTRLHEFLGPGIEDAWLDTFSSAEVTNGRFPAEPFQTMRILSSGAYFLRVADLTCRMKVLVS